MLLLLTAAATWRVGAWPRRNDERRDLNHYRVLGVPRHASTAAIRRAFHQKALTLHPDKRCHKSCDRSAVNAAFARATEAFEALRDPQRRAEYDMQLASDLMNPIGVLLDWAASKSPAIHRGMSKIRRRFREHLRSPGRAAKKTLEWGVAVASDWRKQRDRVHDIAFRGIERLESNSQLSQPVLLAVYSSSTWRLSDDLLDAGRDMRRACSLVEGLKCLTLDCSPWARNTSDLCTRLTTSSWLERLWRGTQPAKLAVIGHEAVRLEANSGSSLRAQAGRALMASRDRVVLDLRRRDALFAFLNRPAGPKCRVVHLADDYEPSKRLVALAHTFKSVAAFAEARASNRKLWDALFEDYHDQDAAIYDFPKFLVLFAREDNSPAMIFDTTDELNDWLLAYQAAYDDEWDTRNTSSASSSSNDHNNNNNNNRRKKNDYRRDSSSSSSSSYDRSAPTEGDALFTRQHLEAMRSTDLRRLLADRGLHCIGCLEKADFINRLLAEA